MHTASAADGEWLAQGLSDHSQLENGARVGGMVARLEFDRGEFVQTRMAGTPALQLQPGVKPQAMCPMPAHGMAFSSQEYSKPPIAIARILRRKALHRRQGRRIPLGANLAYLKDLIRARWRH